MKKFLILFVILTLAASFVNAQVPMPPDSKPDVELTKEEAAMRIQSWESKVNDLKGRLGTLNTEIDGLHKQLNDVNQKLKDCNEEYLRMLGATQADLDAFRQKLGVIEGKVRELSRLPNDVLADKKDEVKALEDELNALRQQKIALLPEFYNKIIELAREIKGLYREKNIKTYTVGTWAENKDCLWNIAGKIEIYGDPFLWPKIWQTNTGMIRNPDIIHPGQVLTLPPKAPKSTEEMKAERKYWRNKKAAEEAVTGEKVEKGETPAAEPKKGK
ncbi:MAG: hypothetical protein QG635_1852 [Bacteroidota bacterium]|nr:hypothetical protein [Bacteroidota bacterium]